MPLGASRGWTSLIARNRDTKSTAWNQNLAGTARIELTESTRYGRGERIRTSDPLVPNQVLYQAEPLPEHVR